MPRTIECGLDVGTSKVCCAIAERAKDGSHQLLGLGSAEHRGIRDGHVVDLDALTDGLQTALHQAEQEARVTVRQCLVSVSVPELQCRSGKGIVPLADYGMEVRVRDVDRVRSQAELMELALDRAILHSIPRSFTVDGQMSVDDPLGLVGRQLAIDLVMLTCPQLVLQNVAKAVHLAGLEVQQFVYTGLATAHAVLTPEDQERTVLVMDLGGTVSDVVLMARGRVAAATVVATGGERISHALIQRLKVQPDEAESLKREAVLSRPSTVTDTIREALTAVLDELAAAWHALPREAGMPESIIITGRSALLDGLLELAEERLQLPVRLGRVTLPTRYFGREQSLLAVTPLGLLNYQRAHLSFSPAPTEPLPWPRRLLVKARELYEDYF